MSRALVDASRVLKALDSRGVPSEMRSDRPVDYEQECKLGEPMTGKHVNDGSRSHRHSGPKRGQTLRRRNISTSNRHGQQRESPLYRCIHSVCAKITVAKARRQTKMSRKIGRIWCRGNGVSVR
ncbi:hypothetical protein PILCRDRAFT_738470 [Piloderma croceum F 1598]|uniref:Uncharacterized protein n=1 Tax=Piloderma croceum (strain F 1598) TaxID=765440 RepID=A0A0C3EYA6_PILCF|nr:hypothetical protein PILCRDRAFT_742415 [Piloderma croceum F 1598]KIM72711.1 hypothetical protein PILCRDRAFT_738470 [Piloderma croceum F 1598]